VERTALAAVSRVQQVGGRGSGLLPKTHEHGHRRHPHPPRSRLRWGESRRDRRVHGFARRPPKHAVALATPLATDVRMLVPWQRAPRRRCRHRRLPDADLQGAARRGRSEGRTGDRQGGAALRAGQDSPNCPGPIGGRAVLAEPEESCPSSIQHGGGAAQPTETRLVVSSSPATPGPTRLRRNPRIALPEGELDAGVQLRRGERSGRARRDDAR
jgi:hypothetical protein